MFQSILLFPSPHRQRNPPRDIEVFGLAAAHLCNATKRWVPLTARGLAKNYFTERPPHCSAFRLPIIVQSPCRRSRFPHPTKRPVPWPALPQSLPCVEFYFCFPFPLFSLFPLPYLSPFSSPSPSPFPTPLHCCPLSSFPYRPSFRVFVGEQPS